jgi:hypothetical protein
MRIKWIIFSCLLFTACSKDEIYEPQWGPTRETTQQTKTTTKSVISLELDGNGLPLDNNGYYHLRLTNKSSQTIHRITGFVKPTTQPIKVEWENNLFWWLRKGDTVANITKLYINPLTGERNYVNLPPITTWRDELVPTINKSSYAGTNGEINTVIAPIYKMKGDTMRITCKVLEHNVSKQLNIVLE